MRIILFASAVILSGCAFTTVTPLKYGDRESTGLRVYDPLPLLVVTNQSSSVVFIPNFERAYAVNFRAWLAKNDVTVKTTNAALTEISSKLDTTGLLSLLQGLGEKAIESAEKFRSLGADVNGSIKDREGVWRFVFKADGALEKMEKVTGF